MVNPLLKRVPRELKYEWRKYLVIAVIMIFMIGIVSGVFVSNNSMMTELSEMYDKYNREDGNFEIDFEADDDLIEALEKEEIPEGMDFDEELYEYSASVYELFYKNESEDNNNDGDSDGDIRIYKMRDGIDEICLMEGQFPSGDGEILIDRMHADNVGVEVGDTITVSGKEFTVTGLGAFSDYSTLHKKNTDVMFDALTFDVAVVTDSDFEELPSRLHYNYAWRYDNEAEDDKEAKKRSDALMTVLLANVLIRGGSIENYVPAYLSQAINFAPDDMGSDKSMMGVMLYVLIAVLAFVFALTTDSSIEKESTVIGTLRASGYTRGEILRHYMAMPVIVTLISAVVGNIIGYTLFVKFSVWAYYNSYSLPTYTTLFTSEALIKTTLVPLALMFVINIVIISNKLRLSPLKFLRHDLKRNKRKKAMRLPSWSFIRRFRLRIFLQNIFNYIVLFIGLIFVAALLAMCIGLPLTVHDYQDRADEFMFAGYQTVLTKTQDDEGNEITTSAEGAEKFATTELIYTAENSFEEPVTVYGIESGSAYVSIPDMDEGEVYISSPFSEKWGFSEGDKLTLSDKYSDEVYDFDIMGVFDYEGAISVFMNIDDYNSLFGKDEDYFSGYFSDEEITDIDEDLIATVITSDVILSMANQLDHSMGFMMDVATYVFAIIAAALIYLLTKVIIEKNETAISMVKILGFKNTEISSLYIITTTVVVLVEDIFATYLGFILIEHVWIEMLKEYSGYFPFVMPMSGFIKIYLLILAAYLLVTIIDFRRIKKIPMDEALKNVE